MENAGGKKHWRYVTSDLKTEHQQNMLKSMVCVYCVVALGVVFSLVWALFRPDTTVISLDDENVFYFSEGNPGGSTGRGHSQFSSVNSAHANEAVSARIPNRPLVDVATGGNTHRYRVIPDKSWRSVAGLPDPMDISGSGEYELLVMSDGMLEYDPFEDYLTFRDGAAGEDHYGLGDNTFGLPNGIYCPPAVRIPFGDRGADELNQPLYLGLLDPGFPRQANKSVVGKVVFEITVYEDSLINYKIKSIEPPCQGFGLATEYAITSGTYRPRLIKGLPVKETLEVTLFYRWTDGQSMTTTEFTSVPGQVQAEWK